MNGFTGTNWQMDNWSANNLESISGMTEGASNLETFQSHNSSLTSLTTATFDVSGQDNFATVDFEGSNLSALTSMEFAGSDSSLSVNFAGANLANFDENSFLDAGDAYFSFSDSTTLLSGSVTDSFINSSFNFIQATTLLVTNYTTS